MLFARERNANGAAGALLPELLVMVNGKRSASTSWSAADDKPAVTAPPGPMDEYAVQIGPKVAKHTGWNLSDMYYVNNWPGTPLTLHKPDGNDMTNTYVTQVNYVSGYVCNASLD